MTDWSFDAWEPVEPAWGENDHSNPDDQVEFHVDLGCGLARKGRIGVDRYPAPGVAVVMDLNSLEVYSHATEANKDAQMPRFNGVGSPEHIGFPFKDGTIKSIIASHVLEHVGDGLPNLLDECHRVLEPNGILRVIVPVFPSYTAMIDPDHRRFFVEGSFDHMFSYEEQGFAVPYVKSRFVVENKAVSPPTRVDLMFTPSDRREMRVTLRKVM